MAEKTANRFAYMQFFLYLCSRKMIKKFTFILFSMLMYAGLLSAETIVLRSGKRITGQVLVQTEEVVIVRDENGARFQFPAADVEQIVGADAAEDNPSARESTESTSRPGGKKAALLLEVAGGAMYENAGQWGGYEAVNLVIGSRQIGGKPITIGGTVGYLGCNLPGKTCHFIPICIALRAPLMEGKHQPLLGADLGYGIAASKAYLGGIHAGIDAGYRYYANRFAISVGLNVRFQQSTIPVIETIEDTNYTNKAGRNLVAVGVKIGLLF